MLKCDLLYHSGGTKSIPGLYLPLYKDGVGFLLYSIQIKS